MDQFTKAVELVPTKDERAETVIQAFNDNIICRWGIPGRLLSDNGPSFRSVLVQSLCDSFNILKVFSTTYYPQGDGYAERFMRTLNNSLSTITSFTAHDWSRHLPALQFGYNIADHWATGHSPFFLNTGRVPSFGMAEGPGKTLSKHARQIRDVVSKAMRDAKNNLEVYHNSMMRQFNRKRHEHTLNVGDSVLIKLTPIERSKYPCRKLAPHWSSIKTIVSMSPNRSHMMVQDVATHKQERVNIHRALPLAHHWTPGPNATDTKARSELSSKDTWVGFPDGETKKVSESDQPVTRPTENLETTDNSHKDEIPPRVDSEECWVSISGSEKPEEGSSCWVSISSSEQE